MLLRAQWFGQRIADSHRGVQGTTWVLEDNLPVEAHIVWIGNGLPVDTDIAGCRSGEPRHNLQQGSFARSRFADDAKAFAPVDV